MHPVVGKIQPLEKTWEFDFTRNPAHIALRVNDDSISLTEEDFGQLRKLGFMVPDPEGDRVEIAGTYAQFMRLGLVPQHPEPQIADALRMLWNVKDIFSASHYHLAPDEEGTAAIESRNPDAIVRCLEALNALKQDRFRDIRTNGNRVYFSCGLKNPDEAMNDTIGTSVRLRAGKHIAVEL